MNEPTKASGWHYTPALPVPASQTSPLLGQARTAIGSINLSGAVMAASIRTGFILIDCNRNLAVGNT